MLSNNNNKIDTSTQNTTTEKGAVKSVDFSNFIIDELKARQNVAIAGVTLRFCLTVDPSLPKRPILDVLRHQCRKANTVHRSLNFGMYFTIISEPKYIFLNILIIKQLNKPRLFCDISEITKLSKDVLEEAYRKEVNEAGHPELLLEDQETESVKEQEQPIQHHPTIPKQALKEFFKSHPFPYLSTESIPTSEEQNNNNVHYQSQSKAIYDVDFNEFIDDEINQYFDENNQTPKQNTFSFILSTNYPEKYAVADEIRSKFFRKDFTSFGFGMNIHANYRNIRLEITDRYNKLNRQTLIRFMSRITCLPEDELQILYQCQYNEKMSKREKQRASCKRSVEQVYDTEEPTNSSKAQKNTSYVDNTSPLQNLSHFAEPSQAPSDDDETYIENYTRKQ